MLSEAKKAKNRERARLYYAANREKCRERMRQRYASNRERFTEYARNYYANNKERLRARQNGWRNANRERVRKLHREWRRTHRKEGTSQALRERKYRRLFGLDPKAYRDILVSQNERCAICCETMSRPHLDHDHETGGVRGVLCQRCNQGIGLLHDDPALLRSAIAYLEKHAHPKRVGQPGRGKPATV